MLPRGGGAGRGGVSLARSQVRVESPTYEVTLVRASVKESFGVGLTENPIDGSVRIKSAPSPGSASGTAAGPRAGDRLLMLSLVGGMGEGVLKIACAQTRTSAKWAAGARAPLISHRCWLFTPELQWQPRGRRQF